MTRLRRRPAVDAFAIMLFAASGCGAPSSPVELIPTSPEVLAACAGELGTTYCALGDANAAARACGARLTPAERAHCDPARGCLVPYVPTRVGTCAPERTYSTPSRCATPVADNCAFYRSCLEAAHPCGANGYALGFGEPLCYLFIDHRDEFTPAGQRWLQGVRTCLQRSLATLVTSPVASCDALADQAFASHTDCYTVPDNSFCALQPEDFNSLTALLLPYLHNPRVTAQIQAVSAICAHRSP